MRKKDIKKLIQVYSEIPIAGNEKDLNRLKTSENLTEKKVNDDKNFGSFIRNRYVIGALTCIILIAIILPISLVFFNRDSNGQDVEQPSDNPEQPTDNPEDNAPELLFCSTDQLNIIALDSIETFNELYGYNVETIHTETVFSAFYELRLKENNHLIGVHKEEYIWDEKIDNVDTIAYTSNYVTNDPGFLYLPYVIDVNGIMYKYNMIHEVDYDYYVEYTVDNVRYQSHIVCYEEVETEKLINDLFV